MKLCKDCKYGPKTIDSGMFGGIPTSICTHPNAPVDPVYGRKDASHSLLRSSNCLIDHCGPEGHWFEEALPKPEPDLQPGAIVWVPDDEPAPVKPWWRFW